MEDNLMRVFSVLVSVIILFILPLYITFEKMDDISYSLALKITSNFVDNVNAKGYLTEEMYNDFISRLSVTGMLYDVKMEHVAKKYNPNYFVYNDSGELINTVDYSVYASILAGYTNDDVVNELGAKKSNIKLSYNTSEIKYTEKQILDEINSNKIKKVYTMNKGDEFSVRIKNENVTIATVLFNAFTLGIGGTENNTRVYINYGGSILEEEFLLGDVNLDGNLTQADIDLIQAYSVEAVSFSPEQLVRADLDNNGKIDIDDVRQLQYLI